VTAEVDVRCLGLSAWAFRALVEKRPTLGAILAETAATRRSGT
jgi:CRP-like cAMP-binding protein